MWFVSNIDKDSNVRKRVEQRVKKVVYTGTDRSIKKEHIDRNFQLHSIRATVFLIYLYIYSELK